MALSIPASYRPVLPCPVQLGSKNGSKGATDSHSTGIILRASQLMDRSSEQQGKPTLSVMTVRQANAVCHDVQLNTWKSSEVSRARILTLFLVAVITLGSGALAQGAGGGGGGAGGGASGAGGAAGANGAHGAAGASGTPGTGNPN